MKAFLTTLLTLALGFSVATAVEEKPAEKEKGQRRADPEKAFKRLDTNSDSKVSLEEFKAGPAGKRDATKAEEVFKKKDKDGDGSLTLEEFKSGPGRKGGKGKEAKPKTE